MSDYSARRVQVDGIETVRLADAARRMEVSIAPSIGNLAYAFRIAGRNILWFPAESLAAFRRDPVLCGVPFLAPWANRLDQDAFWANGRKYLLNPELGNLRRDGYGKPIHGLLLFSPAWEVARLESDGNAAWVTSRLEFWKHPDLMAQFPFAHTIEMTHRLRDGALEVETAVQNHAFEKFPVAIGFHPYFVLDDAPRDAWKAHLAAREHWVLSPGSLPTGETRPLAFADPQPLDGIQFDDLFTGLVRENGASTFHVQGKQQRIAVVYGPRYLAAVVYAPPGPGREFICFEPMAAVTNAFNLAHAGTYSDLQNVPPGGEWRESFWIVPAGF